MKKLTITTTGDHRYGYDLDNGGATSSGGAGLVWNEIEKVIETMSPRASMAAAMQFGGQITSYGQNQAGPYGWVGQSPSNRDLRLECVRLAIQADVDSERLITWASGLEAWISQGGR